MFKNNFLKQSWVRILNGINKIVLYASILGGVIFILSLSFNISPLLFEKTFIVGMLAIAPILILFYVSTLLFLFGKLDNYWNSLYPVSHGILSLGIFAMGSGSSDTFNKLIIILSVSIILSLIIYISKIYNKRILLFLLLVLHWIPGYFVSLISYDAQIKVTTASILLFISIFSLFKMKSKERDFRPE